MDSRPCVPRRCVPALVARGRLASRLLRPARPLWPEFNASGGAGHESSARRTHRTARRAREPTPRDHLAPDSRRSRAPLTRPCPRSRAADPWSPPPCPPGARGIPRGPAGSMAEGSRLDARALGVRYASRVAPRVGAQPALANGRAPCAPLPSRLIRRRSIPSRQAWTRSSRTRTTGLKAEYGLGRGHAMALVHMIEREAELDARHVGSVGSHRDESATLWLDGKATEPS